MSAGRPKRFADETEFVKLFEQFCDEIKENDFFTIPSQSSFCRWLETHYEATDRRTIYNSLNKYFPNLKKEFENLQSDVISEGAMKGKYNATMSIFVLKNWCSWGDKQEISATVTQQAEVTASSRLLKALLDDNTQKMD